MQKKAIGVVILCVALGMAAILYRNLQRKTYREDDILAAYMAPGEYGDIHIEYPLDETLFPPEMVAPVCGNCHSFIADGKTIAMDVDYASNKGSYAITDVREKVVLASDDIIAWNDYAGSGQTHGLLSQISPDGRYAISTVEDLSVFVPSPDSCRLPQ
jgi:hypothetical protein